MGGESVCLYNLVAASAATYVTAASVLHGAMTPDSNISVQGTICGTSVS